MTGAGAGVFLDRDGVVTVPEFRDGRSFAPLSAEDFAIYPDAPEASERLVRAGFTLVVVTNQPDVGRGLIPQQDLEIMHRRLSAALPVSAIEVCPHTREDRCSCRKPAPGMLLRAAEQLGLDLGRSFMVGDRASDVEAGRSAGCRTIFVDRNYEAERPPEAPDHVCRGVGEAADWILSVTRPPTPRTRLLRTA